MGLKIAYNPTSYRSGALQRNRTRRLDRWKDTQTDRGIDGRGVYIYLRELASPRAAGQTSRLAMQAGANAAVSGQKSFSEKPVWLLRPATD